RLGSFCTADEHHRQPRTSAFDLSKNARSVNTLRAFSFPCCFPAFARSCSLAAKFFSELRRNETTDSLSYMRVEVFHHPSVGLRLHHAADHGGSVGRHPAA